MAQVLFEEDSSGSETGFSVSNKYAENYNSWREKEEYQRLQAKYGKDVALDAGHGDDESSSSSEDDEAEELTPQMEKQFFETLSKLKQNDPEIYDPSRRFFKERQEQEDPGSKKKRKEKPMFLRDYEREMLLKTGGVEEDGAGPSAADGPQQQQQKSYMEEQEEIRAGFRSLVEDASDTEDAGFSTGLLKKRKKTEDEQTQEDEHYKTWLKGQKETVGDKAVEGRLKGLKDAWSNPKIAKDEAFLRDYILSKRYLEEGDDSYVPSYEEVVHDSEGDLSEDERTVTQQEQFEHKFNFRFEEPDQDFIKRYPRTVNNSLRKKDERRKLNREDVKKRKEEEKYKKEEELKRLKTLKRKEIMAKLETLKEAVGNAELPFEVNDLDADFDPESHDRKMHEMFGEDYYYDAENDEEKPVFSGDEEDWDNWAPEDGDGDGQEGEQQSEDYYQQEAGSSHAQQDGPDCEQPGFVMDCDYSPAAAAASARLAPAELVTGRGRKKRRGRLAELLRHRKPRFDPSGAQPLAEYVDQYYRLDEQANPHPFRYRQVAENDFGLDTEEILMADERDLNRWVSVKRMSQYVRPEEEQHDIKIYKAKASNAFYKQKILQSLYTKEGEQEQDPEAYEPQTKKKKKRKRKDKEAAEEQPNGHGLKEGQEAQAGEEGQEAQAGEDWQADTETGAAPDATEEAAAEPEAKKKKKKRRKKEKAAAEEAADGEVDQPAENGDSAAPEEAPEAGKKKKKKKKRGELTLDGDAADAGATEAAADQQQAAQHGAGKKKRSRDEPASDGAAHKRRRQQPDGRRPRRGPKPEAGTQAAMVLSMSDARLEAFGLNPKKIRGKVIYGKGDA